MNDSLDEQQEVVHQDVVILNGVSTSVVSTDGDSLNPNNHHIIDDNIVVVDNNNRYRDNETIGIGSIFLGIVNDNDESSTVNNTTTRSSHPVINKRNSCSLLASSYLRNDWNIENINSNASDAPDEHQNYQPQQQSNDIYHNTTIFLSNEIIGIIKSKPEDFIVREIRKRVMNENNNPSIIEQQKEKIVSSEDIFREFIPNTSYQNDVTGCSNKININQTIMEHNSCYDIADIRSDYEIKNVDTFQTTTKIVSNYIALEISNHDHDIDNNNINQQKDTASAITNENNTNLNFVSKKHKHGNNEGIIQHSKKTKYSLSDDSIAHIATKAIITDYRTYLIEIFEKHCNNITCCLNSSSLKNETMIWIDMLQTFSPNNDCSSNYTNEIVVSSSCTTTTTTTTTTKEEFVTDDTYTKGLFILKQLEDFHKKIMIQLQKNVDVIKSNSVIIESKVSEETKQRGRSDNDNIADIIIDKSKPIHTETSLNIDSRFNIIRISFLYKSNETTINKEEFDNGALVVGEKRKHHHWLPFDVADFHNAFRTIFPLLTSERIFNNDENMYIIEMTQDTFFHELIPYLYQPHIDIPILFTYYKRGYMEVSNNVITTTTSTTINNKDSRKEKRKQFKGHKFGSRNHEPRNGVSHESTQNISNLPDQNRNPILVLKPGLSKIDRRNIHQLIDTKTKGQLGTNTIATSIVMSGENESLKVTEELLEAENISLKSICANDESNHPSHEDRTDVTLPPKGDNNGETDPISSPSVVETVAVCVSWTKIAERKFYAKKRKREQDQKDSHGTGLLDHANIEAPNTKRRKNNLCVVKKRGIEHLSAMTLIAKAFNCRQPDIGFAGIKDRNAITYQYCTIPNLPMNRINAGRKFLQNHNMDLSIISEVDYSLRKGDLVGNQFDISVRNLRRVSVTVLPNNAIQEEFIRIDDEHLERMIQRVKTNGFVNYYGEQRVGEPGITGVRAFDVGRAMLQHDFMKAIDLLMTGRQLINGVDVTVVNKDSEPTQIQAFRQEWKNTNGNIEASMEKLPKTQELLLQRERILLKGLKRYGKENALAALRCLQHSDRMFFVNAYQSYVWNRMTTERLRRYGTSVVDGDLVIRHGQKLPQTVSSHDDDFANLTITDVVLPLPGYDVLYPSNEIGSLYLDLLNQDKIFFDKSNKTIPEEGTAKGSYRHIVVKVLGNKISYTKVIDSDTCIETEMKATTTTTTSVNNYDVRLTFQLPKGCYATIFMRELMMSTVVRDILLTD